MIHHQPPERTETKTCAHCSVEKAATSSRAEEWYMQSDGPEGVVRLAREASSAATERNARSNTSHEASGLLTGRLRGLFGLVQSMPANEAARIAGVSDGFEAALEG